MQPFGQLFAVAGVLMLLGCALYFLRRKGIARASGGTQLQSIDRLPLTPQHSLHLIRVYGRIVLIAVSPGGCSVLDGSAWTTAAEERTAAR
jgi:flagellar biogenesis protein FliO